MSTHGWPTARWPRRARCASPGASWARATTASAFGPRLPGLLDEADADVVVVLPGVGELGDREIDGRWRHLGDPAYDAWLRQRLEDLADRGVGRRRGPVVWATTPHVQHRTVATWRRLDRRRRQRPGPGRPAQRDRAPVAPTARA